MIASEQYAQLLKGDDQLKQLGTTVLAIWLLLVGLMGVADLSFKYDHLLQGILAIAAGVLLLMKR